MRKISASFIIIASIASSPSLAGELFTDFNLSAEEGRQFKKSRKEELKSAKTAIESIMQLRLLTKMMPLAEGNCDSIANIDDEAKAGETTSQTALAFAYFEGYCVKKNVLNAAKWFRKAAEAGHKTAQEQLGLLLLKGHGKIKANPQAAVRYVKMAADNNVTNAQYVLGGMYEEGNGLPKDIAAARSWYEKAATKGHEIAIFSLARMYLAGLGVKQDMVKALNWFLFGAKRGSVVNQYGAAIALANSNSRQDLIQAYKWANLAAAKLTKPNLIEEARDLLKKLEPNLSLQDITQAQQLSSAWKADTTVAAPNSQSPKQQRIEQARIDDPTATPEQKAAREEIYKRGIQLTRIAFFKAIQKDNLELVRLFRRAGASLEALAIGAGDGPLGVTPLYVAVDWGAYKVYRYLMDNNVNINAGGSETGWTPLVRALSHNRLDMARELLDRGADASQGSSSGGNVLADLIKTTALAYTVSQSDPELVRRVLAQGGSIQERYANGDTPLLHAVKFGGSTEVMKVLLDAGADIDEGDKFGVTPLLGSFQDDKVRLDALRFLLANKANPAKGISAQGIVTLTLFTWFED